MGLGAPPSAAIGSAFCFGSSSLQRAYLGKGQVEPSGQARYLPQEEMFHRLLSAVRQRVLCPPNTSLPEPSLHGLEPSGCTAVDTEAPKCASCPAAASNSCVPETELCLTLRAAADHSLPPTPKVYPLLVLAGFLLHSCLGVRGLGHPRRGRLSSQAL